MPKILKEQLAKPIGEEVIAMIREKHPTLTDQQIRAVLNYAAKMTTPFVKKADPVTEEVADPVTEEVADPVTEEVADPVTEEVADPVTESFQ